MRLALPDSWIIQDSRSKQLAEAGIDAAAIARAVRRAVAAAPSVEPKPLSVAAPKSSVELTVTRRARLRRPRADRAIEPRQPDERIHHLACRDHRHRDAALRGQAQRIGHNADAARVGVGDTAEIEIDLRSIRAIEIRRPQLARRAMADDQAPARAKDGAMPVAQ